MFRSAESDPLILDGASSRSIYRAAYHAAHCRIVTVSAGLTSARHLYEKAGFRLCREEDGSHLKGKSSLTELVFDLINPAQT